jgi:hypothetical protein
VAFPPPPHPFHGRAAELRTLVAACRSGVHPRIALVGPGGGGKSTLAAALGHRLRAGLAGGVEWLRAGRWDHRTLVDMLAIRLGVPLGRLDDRARRVAAVRRRLGARGRTLIVLDNHENDREMARFLDAFAGAPALWVLTARRCLLSGVSVFPVVPPLVTAGGTLFRAVAELTELVRWNPLALDVCDAIVGSGAASVGALRAWLLRRGVARVRPIAHEDDVPEVRALVAWVWPRVGATGRRLLGVMAHVEGDHTAAGSLAALARAGAGEAARALARLRRFRLVQEPLPGRFTLHATVKHAIGQLSRARFDPARAARHFVALLEAHPERLDLEQTHLFAALDHAQAASDLRLSLHLDRLMERLGLA